MWLSCNNVCLYNITAFGLHCFCQRKKEFQVFPLRRLTLPLNHVSCCKPSREGILHIMMHSKKQRTDKFSDPNFCFKTPLITCFPPPPVLLIDCKTFIMSRAKWGICFACEAVKNSPETNLYRFLTPHSLFSKEDEIKKSTGLIITILLLHLLINYMR